MDAKTAIASIDDVLSAVVRYDESIEYQLTTYDCDWLEAAKGAIEKQIPVKPKLVFGEKTNTHRYGRLISFHCPSCGRFILALYETDVERGGGISNDLRGCSKCLQAIDFAGYYHKNKENEEAVFDD